MTIKFIEPTGSYTDAVKFSMNAVNLSGVMTLELVSLYNKHEIDLDLTIVETNGRYTEFATDYTDELGNDDLSGFYTFTLKQDGDARFSGLLKMINNKTKSLENKDKYVGPNQEGSGYVIYE